MSTTHETHLEVTSTTHPKVQEVDEQGNVLAEKDLSHVISGLKSTIKSSRTSEAAKESAQERINQLEEALHPSQSGEGGGDHESEVHQHRVIGGLRAALHRDTTSDEKKQEIREKLAEMGVGEHAE